MDDAAFWSRLKAIATAAVAAQELYPKMGRGPIPHADLQVIQRKREADVRTLHRLQLGAQRVLVAKEGGVVKRLLAMLLPVMLNSPLVPRIQRRLFFGVPLPPLDSAFAFSE